MRLRGLEEMAATVVDSETLADVKVIVLLWAWVWDFQCTKPGWQPQPSLIR